MIDIQSFLINQGWDHKKTGTHAILKHCPYCAKENHFYINLESGGWDCKSCMECGGIKKLKRDFTNEVDFKKLKIKKEIKYIAPAQQQKPEKNYLNQVRKISKEVIEKAEICFRPFEVGFVYKDLKEKKAYTIKWRKTNDKEFYYEPNSEIYFPYFIEGVDFTKDYIILCEGEIDCLTWKTYGYENCIGIPGAGTFKGEWIDFLDSFKTIYLNMDNDKNGIEGAQKIIEKIKDDVEEIKIIKFDKKDINECLVAGYNKTIIDNAFNGAEKYKHTDIKHVSEIITRRPTKDDFGLSTGFDNLDNLTKWRMGELTLFTAHTKAGKTTFLLNLILNQITNNVGCLIGSFEMTLESIKKKLYSAYIEENYYLTATDDKIETFNNAVKYFPLYFINHYGAYTDDKKMFATIKYAAKHHDVKIVMLDHLSYLYNYSASTAVHEIGQIMRKIKKIALDLGVHIFLIVHPRSTEDESQISEFTLRGSAEIAQICDNMFILKTNKETFETSLNLKLPRHDLARAGTCYFKFDTEKQKYFESEKPITVDTNYFQNKHKKRKD